MSLNNSNNCVISSWNIFILYNIHNTVFNRAITANAIIENAFQSSLWETFYLKPCVWRYEVSSSSRDDISLGRLPHNETAYLLPFVCMEGSSTWPDLNLSDIGQHVSADSTWESSQNSSSREIHSLVFVVGLHFLTNTQRQHSEVPVCAGYHWPHKYFTSKKPRRQEALDETPANNSYHLLSNKSRTQEYRVVWYLQERYWKDRNRGLHCAVCVGLCMLPDALTCGCAVDTNPRLEAIYQSQGAAWRNLHRQKVKCGLLTLGNRFLGNLLTDP